MIPVRWKTLPIYLDYITTSKAVGECSSSKAKFEVDGGGNRLKKSDACIKESENGYLLLGDCNDNSSIFHIPTEIHPSTGKKPRIHWNQRMVIFYWVILMTTQVHFTYQQKFTHLKVRIQETLESEDVYHLFG